MEAVMKTLLPEICMNLPEGSAYNLNTTNPERKTEYLQRNLQCERLRQTEIRSFCITKIFISFFQRRQVKKQKETE
jgi:hypothetical protein